MDPFNARWGHSASEFGERFWSQNSDGRYTVAFYPPETIMLEPQQLSPGRWIEKVPGHGPAVASYLPVPGPIRPSHANEENFVLQLQSFANALTQRLPLQKEIMSYKQLVYLHNKDLARRYNMSSYIKRITSFANNTDEQDRYIYNAHCVKELAEAGLFNYPKDTMLGSKPPLLICFACGFEIGGMHDAPVEAHLTSIDSACTFKVGYEMRKEMQHRLGVQEQAQLSDQPQIIRDEALHVQLSRLQELGDRMLKQIDRNGQVRRSVHGQNRAIGDPADGLGARTTQTGTVSAPKDYDDEEEEEEEEEL